MLVIRSKLLVIHTMNGRLGPRVCFNTQTAWRPLRAPGRRTGRTGLSRTSRPCFAWEVLERDFSIDNLLVRIHVIIVMIRWTGLAPWEFEFPFSGSRTSTFLRRSHQPSRLDQMVHFRFCPKVDFCSKIGTS